MISSLVFPVVQVRNGGRGEAGGKLPGKMGTGMRGRVSHRHHGDSVLIVQREGDVRERGGSFAPHEITLTRFLHNFGSGRIR